MQSEDHNSTSHNHIKKKRVGKACDSCRIKKTKCDGKKPCNRCILDNKICVFTEKKKQREKNHPNGYIELLETRLDILTKLFNKLIELSQPHLGFIDEIIEENRQLKLMKKQQQQRDIDDDSSDDISEGDEEHEGGEGDDVDVVPINRVISYLINQQGLLNNVPVEWEQGTMIAANFDPKKNLNEAANLFANHRQQISPASPVLSPQSQPSNPSRSKKSSIKVKQEHSSPIFAAAENLNLGLSTAITNKRSTNELLMSDFDSDLDNPLTHNQLGESLSPPDHYNRQPATTLFVYDAPILSKTSSITSLTNKYENHTLLSPQLSATSPTPTPTLATGEVLSTIRRSSSSLSHKKLKNSGHVSKPNHIHSHNHNHGNMNTVKRESADSSTSSSGSIIPSPMTMNQQSLFNQDIRGADLEIFNNVFDNHNNNNNKIMTNIFPSDPLMQHQQQQQPLQAGSPVEFPFGQPFQSLDVLTATDGLDSFMNGGNNPFMGKY